MTAERMPTLTIPVPSRESIAAKSRRYLLEGRLNVLLVHRDRIYAECRGNGAVWHPCFTGGLWRCDCPVGRGRCAHVAALKFVTTEPNHRGDRTA